jgi:hypothetical protein
VAPAATNQAVRQPTAIWGALSAKELAVRLILLLVVGLTIGVFLGYENVKITAIYVILGGAVVGALVATLTILWFRSGLVAASLILPMYADLSAHPDFKQLRQELDEEKVAQVRERVDRLLAEWESDVQPGSLSRALDDVLGERSLRLTPKARSEILAYAEAKLYMRVHSLRFSLTPSGEGSAEADTDS